MTGLVFSGSFLPYNFLYQSVLGFLLIARDYLSVVYCGFISRCMYYLTVKILQLSADMNQDNFFSLVYLYRTSGLVNVTFQFVFPGRNCHMWQMKTIALSPYKLWIFNAYIICSVM